ncbi:hypothetical protein [Streptomyces coelicoflavus]|uniref:hypothetical protein n=1 Tax=Streptomyces coelicoflavus TaxID=285562 RepID=UPI0036CE6B61
MRTIGELRAALTLDYGFAGDADDFEADLARAISHADPTGLSNAVRLVEEFPVGWPLARTPPSAPLSPQLSQRFRRPGG